MHRSSSNRVFWGVLLVVIMGYGYVFRGSVAQFFGFGQSTATVAQSGVGALRETPVTDRATRTPGVLRRQPTISNVIRHSAPRLLANRRSRQAAGGAIVFVIVAILTVFGWATQFLSAFFGYLSRFAEYILSLLHKRDE